MLRTVAVVLALASCRGKNDGPPCGAVAASFLRIANADLDRSIKDQKLDEATRRAVLDQLPAMRDSLLHACTDTKWTREMRTCLANAADHAAFQKCQASLSESQRRALDVSATGKPDAH